MAHRIGTSGFSFPDWVGSFYPRGVRREQMLEFYATEFDCVEINSTYYGIPAPHVLERMAARTPPSFRFIVKANSVVTHEQREDREVDLAFEKACAPLRDAGKLAGTLAQFPWSFRNAPESHAYLRGLRARLPDVPIFVEFRHASWATDATFALLREAGLSYSIVDAPRLDSLMPTVVRAADGLGYLRLHGRNAKNWWSNTGGGRYDYDYSEAELIDWVNKIRELAEQTTTTYIFFNNCHAGQAARNAKLLKQLLAGEPS